MTSTLDFIGYIEISLAAAVAAAVFIYRLVVNHRRAQAIANAPSADTRLQMHLFDSVPHATPKPVYTSANPVEYVQNGDMAGVAK